MNVIEKIQYVIVYPIYHNNSLTNPRYHKDNLQNFFYVLIKAKRDNIFTIKYDYATNAYYSYLIENQNFDEIDLNDTTNNLTINTIYDVVTTKSI